MSHDCPFCDYSGPSEVLFDWGDNFAIEPINPVVEGHVLIIPRQHVPHLTAVVEVTAKTMQRAAEWAMVAGGDCNIITSKGTAATQTVHHLHVHVVPRREGDGLALPWTPNAEGPRWADGSTDPKRVLVCESCGCPRDLCEDRGCDGGPFREIHVVPASVPREERGWCDGYGYITRTAKLVDEDGNVSSLQTCCPGCPACQSRERERKC